MTIYGNETYEARKTFVATLLKEFCEECLHQDRCFLAELAMAHEDIELPEVFCYDTYGDVNCSLFVDKCLDESDTVNFFDRRIT